MTAVTRLCPDRCAPMGPPEPRILGACAYCGRDLYAWIDTLREGDDGRLYCDAVCAGYGQSMPYVPEDGRGA